MALPGGLGLGPGGRGGRHRCDGGGGAGARRGRRLDGPGALDLAQLAANLVATAASRYPNLEIQAVSSLPVAVPADEKRIAQVGDILLTHACGSASRRVSFQTRFASADAEAEWSVVDDRPPDGNEQLEQLFSPLDMNRHPTTGIGLALAKRLVLLHGGQIAAERSEGNFCVRVRLPRKGVGKGPQELTN